MQSKKSTNEKESTNPMRIRLPKNDHEILLKIAACNNLKFPELVRLILGQTAPEIERHGLTIKPGKKASGRIITSLKSPNA